MDRKQVVPQTDVAKVQQLLEWSKQATDAGQPWDRETWERLLEWAQVDDHAEQQG